MNSKVYERPSLSMAKIEMTDLCAGSGIKQGGVNLEVAKGYAESKAFRVAEGGLKNENWDANF